MDYTVEMTIGIYCCSDLGGEVGKHAISKQIEKGTAFAIERGFSIKIFNDTNNSGYVKLYEAIAQKDVVGVWVESIQLLSDSVHDLLFFLTNVYQNNCHLYVGKKRYKPGNLDFYLLAQKALPIASEELHIFMPPQHLGRTKSINDGKRVSQNVFGYEYRDYQNTLHISINTSQAEIVKSIFDFYVDKNMSLSEIERELAGKNTRMANMIRNGKLIEGRFTRYQIMMILKRPEYIGKTYNRDHTRLLDSQFPSFIERNTWKRAQELQKQRSISNRPENILSEIAHCSLCGSPYYYRKSGYLFHRIDNRSSEKCESASSIKAILITDLIKVSLLMKAFDKNLLEHQANYLKMTKDHFFKFTKKSIEIESAFISKNRTVSVLAVTAKDSDRYKRNFDSLQKIIHDLSEAELSLKIDAISKTTFYESLSDQVIDSIVNCDDTHLVRLIKVHIRSITIGDSIISILFFNKKKLCLPLYDVMTNKYVLAYYVIKNKKGYMSYPPS